MDLLAREHWTVLVRHAEIELGPLRDEAQDIVQGVLADILAGEFQLELVPASRRLAYVKKIIFYRVRNRRRKSVHQPLEERDHHVHPCDPWREAARYWIEGRLRAAIAALPPHERTVLIQSCIEGKATAEIAEVEDVSRAAVRQRLRRARRKLRERLGRHVWSW